MKIHGNRKRSFENKSKYKYPQSKYIPRNLNEFNINSNYLVFLELEINIYQFERA